MVVPTDMIQIKHLTGICAGVHTMRVNREGELGMGMSQIRLEMWEGGQAEGRGGLSSAPLLGDGPAIPLYDVSCTTHKSPTFFKLQLLPADLAGDSES